MNRLMARCLAAILIALAWAAPVMAQGEEVVLKILDSWKKKQTSIKSVRYTLSGTSERARASVEPFVSEAAAIKGGRQPPNADVLAKLRPTTIQAVLLIDLEKMRYRIEGRQESLSLVTNGYQPEFHIHAWNREELQSAMPREENPSLGPANPEVEIATGNLR